MATLTASNLPSTSHLVEAVFRHEMDTGITFGLRCRLCNQTFKTFGMDESQPGLVKMYEVVNKLWWELDRINETLKDEVCDHGNPPPR